MLCIYFLKILLCSHSEYVHVFALVLMGCV